MDGSGQRVPFVGPPLCLAWVIQDRQPGHATDPEVRGRFQQLPWASEVPTLLRPESKDSGFPPGLGSCACLSLPVTVRFSLSCPAQKQSTLQNLLPLGKALGLDLGLG